MSYDGLRPHQIHSQSMTIPHRSVGDLLAARRRAAPDKVFLITPGDGEEAFTHARFGREVEAAAAFLRGLSVQKGDRVAIALSNSAEFLLLYFAALSLGATVIPINVDLAPDEILFIARNSRAKLLVHLPELEAKIAAIGERLAPVRSLRVERLPAFAPSSADPVAGAHAIREAAVAPADEAVIIYTSGTTGNPKGVVLTHLNFLADAMAISQWFRFSDSTRTLGLLPLFHNNGQVVTLLAPLYGGGSTVIVKGKSSPMAFWGLVQKYGITWTSVMPSILAILLSLPRGRSDQTLEGIICGGQILTRALREEFECRFGVPVFEGFGLTETTSFACFNRFPKELRRGGSVGTPLPVNDMKVVDANGAEMAAGDEGEILIRGLNVAKEYFDLPERNLAAFRDGWFHSGDFGYCDAAGYFYFLCRKDNLIIKGGENIYPAELENVLFQHPAVAECAVIGVSDSLLGEDLAAFVKVKDGMVASEDELKRHCSGKLAKFKQARRILIVNELADLKDIPKGPTAKVLTRVLKDYYVTRVEPGNQS